MRHGSPTQGGIGGDSAVPHREVLEETRQSHTGRYGGGTAVPHREVLEETRQSHTGRYGGGTVVPHKEVLDEARQSHSRKSNAVWADGGGLDTCVITTRMILH